MMTEFPKLNLALEDQDGTMIVSDFGFESAAQLCNWFRKDPIAHAFEWIFIDPRDELAFEGAEFAENLEFELNELELNDEYDDEDEDDFDLEALITSSREEFSDERRSRSSSCSCGMPLRLTQTKRVKAEAEVAHCPNDGEVVLRYLTGPLRPDLHGIELFGRLEDQLGLGDDWEGYVPKSKPRRVR